MHPLQSACLSAHESQDKGTNTSVSSWTSQSRLKALKGSGLYFAKCISDFDTWGTLKSVQLLGEEKQAVSNDFHLVEVDLSQHHSVFALQFTAGCLVKE